MVLQQGMAVSGWGSADAGEQVRVSFAGQTKSATAAADGKWMVKLDNLQTSDKPAEMIIAGKNNVAIKDVLVGEVWLGSGQSNMEFTVSKNLQKYPNQAKRFAGVINEEEEIAKADYPLIRMFTVKMKTSGEVLDDVEGQWQVCTPQNVPGFSAVGYFFSRDLFNAIHRPVGFINSSYGASCAQAWISKSALESDPKFKPVLDTFDTAMARYQQQLAEAATRPAPTTQTGRGNARPPRSPVSDQHQPFVLYNAMLKGIQPYAIKGALWYQGESITTGGTEMYTQLMNLLIQSWRQQWGQGDFPFYFVQLASLDNNSNRPEVREAQAKSLSMPNTAMAVTTDIGNKSDVHPHDKQTLGDRLARIARARDYGEAIEYAGPMYESMKVDGNKIRVKFSHAGKGLVSKGDELKMFEIAGADGKFIPAKATIDGDSVIVSAEGVSQPTAVRYAWNRWADDANLYNADGLPAAQFRSNTE
jgi:sialate O-acetylesterase